MKSNYVETKEVILKSLKDSKKHELAIKLVIDGECDQYFGAVREITDTVVTVEYYDCVDTVKIDTLTDVFITW